MTEHIKDKARRLIAIDRSEGIRKLADQDNSYCVFASVYQAAYALNPGISKRVPEVLKEWEQINIEGKAGRVPPTKLIDILAETNKILGTKVNRILANPSFIKHLNISKKKEHLKPVQDKEPNKKPKWATHAEFYDFSSQTQRRIDELFASGWSDAMVIEIGLNKGKPQVSEDIVKTMKSVTGVYHDIHAPMIRVLAKRKK